MITNIIKDIVSKDIQFTKKEISQIIYRAFISVVKEKEYNFDFKYHMQNMKKNPIDNGCGCYYCILRKQLRDNEIKITQLKRELKRTWRTSTNEEIKVYRDSIKYLRQVSADIQERKRKIEYELDFISR
jgi:hypothetical protein